MGILCDLIVSAKDKNKDSLMEIINKFRPLIKKQAYALNYEDAENDLIVDMIELIYNMPFFSMMDRRLHIYQHLSDIHM